MSPQARQLAKGLSYGIQEAALLEKALVKSE
jgi:hypothetical protein